MKYIGLVSAIRHLFFSTTTPEYEPSVVAVFWREPLSERMPVLTHPHVAGRISGLCRKQGRLAPRRRLSKTACCPSTQLLISNQIQNHNPHSSSFCYSISSSKHYGSTACREREHTALNSCSSAPFHRAAG